MTQAYRRIGTHQPLSSAQKKEKKKGGGPASSDPSHVCPSPFRRRLYLARRHSVVLARVGVRAVTGPFPAWRREKKTQSPSPKGNGGFVQATVRISRDGGPHKLKRSSRVVAVGLGTATYVWSSRKKTSYLPRYPGRWKPRERGKPSIVLSMQAGPKSWESTPSLGRLQSASTGRHGCGD